MSVTLRSTTGVIEVHWWFEAARDGRDRLPFRDRTYARAFLGRLGDRPDNLTALRRFAQAQLVTPSFRVDDAALLDELARWVVCGRLRIAVDLPALRGLAATEEATAAPDVAWDAPQPAEPDAPVVEAPTFPPDIDAAAIAAAMREAAREGIPFCEPCLRKKLAAQRAAAARSPPPPVEASPSVDAAAMAATLRRAAQLGAPFCEQCEKAEAADAAGGGGT